MTAAPFAEPADLAGRLGVPVWTDALELARVELLLGDATEHLRGVVGWQVSPPATVRTVTQNVRGPWLELPGSPIGPTVTATFGGVALSTSSYQLVDGALHRLAGWPDGVVVTYEVGYATVPRDLVSWTCVLASQALSALEDLGALGGGGVSYVALDDFRKGWNAGGDAVGFVLPQRVEEQLRARYGSAVFVTGSHAATDGRGYGYAAGTASRYW